VCVLFTLDGRSAVAHLPDDGPVLAATEDGASPSLFEFDPLMTNDSAGDAAMPQDANVFIPTVEVQCVGAYMIGRMTLCLF